MKLVTLKLQKEGYMERTSCYHINIEKISYFDDISLVIEGAVFRFCQDQYDILINTIKADWREQQINSIFLD
jgi:hypothetical protein